MIQFNEWESEMGAFSSWITSRGFDLGEGLIKYALGTPGFEAEIARQLDVIDHKLDVLIGSPYRQARMHLREGEIEKAKDKLIEAISLNELDLPAKAMYCLLLCRTGKARLALEYFGEIIREFGVHGELIPKEIVAAYGSYLSEEMPLRTLEPFHVEARQGIYPGYPIEVYCTLSSIIVRWMWPGNAGGMFTSRPVKSGLVVYDWTGKVLMKLSETVASWSILAVSEEYLAISRAEGFVSIKEVVDVYRIKDGSRVLTPHPITAAKVGRLFGSNEDCSVCCLGDRSLSLSGRSLVGMQLFFSGAKIWISSERKEVVNVGPS